MSGGADELTIRRARPDEADALTDLSLRSKRSNGYDDAFMAACREELTVTPAHMTAGEYWVAADDALVGCVALFDGDEPGTGEIHAYFIDPAWRRRGVGKRLWARVLDRARARRYAALGLDADPAAAPFYRSLGFATVGESPSGSIPGRSIPRMKLSLG